MPRYPDMDSSATHTPIWVDTPEALQQVCELLHDSTWLTLDTEFFRENTYYPELCLVQIANTEHIVLIDPLALPDLDALRDLLFRTDIVKILHAAS